MSLASQVNALATAVGTAIKNAKVTAEDRTLPFTMSDVLTVKVGTTSQVPIAGGTWSIVSVSARVRTAPTGSTILVDVNKNGTTIYGTQANRPTIAIGANNATVGAASVTSVTTGDYLSVDVDQVGSTVAGADLVVVIQLQRTA